MKLVKFRTYCYATKDFCYSGGGGDLQQFIGITDKNMRKIYEEDVVTFKTDTKEDIGIVRYMNDYCSYVVEVKEGYDLFADISFDSLEVVGNTVEDYMWDESGKFIKTLDLS